jgi:pimeloyl-ACP methyl ester carboxylesterase
MATAVIDGILTRYEVLGSGPPILMYSPGGFDATVEKWTTQGIYPKLKLLDNLPRAYTCIMFDRRETGQSGGRVERVTWAHYVAQGKGLLDHLGIARAHIMGGCMGCCPVTTFATMYPQATLSMVLYWPVGGAAYRISSHRRFAGHLGYLQTHDLAQVALVAQEGKPFGADPRGGPWASVIKHDPAFATAFASQNAERYKLILSGMMRALFDRDTAPGAEPEELMRLDIPAFIVPGRDGAHATSAARYLEECLPGAEYHDLAVAEQHADSIIPRLMDFLGRASAKA